MANRFPLVADASGIKELPSGDNLDMTGSGIVNAGAVAMTGTLTGGTDTTISGTFTGGQVDILGQGDLRLQDSSGGQYVAMQAPATISASYTLTMPADDGDANQVLQTNGSGVLDWVTFNTPGAALVATQVDLTAQGDVRFQDASGGEYVALQAPATVSASYTLTLPVNDGDADQVLATDGAGVTSWVTSGGLYNAWLVKTSAYTALSGDQIVANHASTAFTITLPASPSAGDTVTFKNAGAALLTIGRNGSNINSAAGDSTMPQGNAAQLIFIDATIGWLVL